MEVEKVKGGCGSSLSTSPSSRASLTSAGALLHLCTEPPAARPRPLLHPPCTSVALDHLHHQHHHHHHHHPNPHHHHHHHRSKPNFTMTSAREACLHLRPVNNSSL
ncbi:unnamed protein product [Pleuronectes platessa]|uniref:Uncharacterized protein n=1 Tax=Pleuronectes platessa TaxID=8262 RepID=A0A9N7VUZ4_PLEPL|nr:unnamed protein product [Pleuronectes platessa]